MGGRRHRRIKNHLPNSAKRRNFSSTKTRKAFLHDILMGHSWTLFLTKIGQIPVLFCLFRSFLITISIIQIETESKVRLFKFCLGNGEELFNGSTDSLVKVNVRGGSAGLVVMGGDSSS